MKRYLLPLLLVTTRLSAATITATGSWSSTLSTANLTGGAGTNLASTLTSSSSQILIDVTGTPVLGSYRVYARVSSTSVPAGVTLAVKRTSDGDSFLSLGVISGGTSFISLSTTDTEIFTGALDRYNIPLQIRASGISVAISPAVYQPSIILTVTP